MSDAFPHTLQALLDERDWVRALARRLAGDAHEAEDLAQDALAIAWERPPRRDDNLRGWLAAVVRNLARQRRRRPAPERAAEEIAPLAAAPTTAEVVESAEVHHLVVQEVLALDEPYRSTVLLHYFEGLRATEIAAREGVPLSTVKSRLTRAHARLRERLDRVERHDRRGMAVLAPLLSPRIPPADGATLASSAALVMGVKIKLAAVVLVLALVALGVRLASSSPDESDVAVVERATESAPAAAPALEDAPEDVARRAGAVEPSATVAHDHPVVAVTGTVFRYDGSPAAEATVVLGAVGALAFMDLDEEAPEGVPLTTTDAEGRFSFAEAPAGTLLVTAGAENAAPSETLQLEERDGGAPVEVALSLRRGVRIHGEVLRKDGALAAGWRLRFMQNGMSLGATGTRLLRWAETDADGRFDERHLCPGTWGLVAYPEDDELKELGGSMPEHMIQSTVELEDGQELFVALGARSAEAVTVRGRITLRGEPAGGGFLQWMSECDDPTGSMQNVRVAADGAYEIELTRPGAWSMRAMGGGGQGEFVVDVPAESEHTIDFELPAATLRGRVVDPDGEPVEGALVSHVLALGAAHHSPMRVMADRQKTDASGAFELVALTPGLYRIGVTHAERGCGVASELVEVVEGDSLEGFELEIAPGFPVTGRVVDAEGLPVAFAPIWIHDAAGRLVNPITGVMTSEDGTFATFPVPPGEYAVLTRRERTCAQALGVIVEDESPDPVELQLADGATIVVEARKGEVPVRAQAVVRDLDGRLLSGLRFARNPWSWRTYPYDSMRRHVGPLPAGTYTVTSNAPGVGSASIEVTVTPGATREVELELL
ncbi:MAG: sigma-70 family RNA polymerase sigma factor [Planctomycetota bacterium]